MLTVNVIINDVRVLLHVCVYLNYSPRNNYSCTYIEYCILLSTFLYRLLYSYTHFVPRCFRVFLLRTITKENCKMSGEKKAFRRLPESIKPVLYDLYLKPDLQNFTFDGKQTVTINVSTFLLTRF